jgi:hypothetical protein
MAGFQTFASFESSILPDPPTLRQSHVQRLHSNHDQLANVFARRPNEDTAAKFRAARSQTFATSAEVTGVAMAA